MTRIVKSKAVLSGFLVDHTLALAASGGSASLVSWKSCVLLFVKFFGDSRHEAFI